MGQIETNVIIPEVPETPKPQEVPHSEVGAPTSEADTIESPETAK